MRTHRLMIAVMLAGGVAIGPAFATIDVIHAPASARADRANPDVTPQESTDRNADLAAAQGMLSQSRTVLRAMQSDPAIQKLMDRSKAIFIVPEYGRAALIVGAGGGGGVLLTNNHGNWSMPLFLNAAAGSLGLQVGASGGPMAFLVMTDRALEKFTTGAGWSLNAAAGLNVAAYSSETALSPDKDIVVWSGLKGLYAGAGVDLTGISYNSAYNNAIYGDADAQKILAGNAPANRFASDLRADIAGPTNVMTARIHRGGSRHG